MHVSQRDIVSALQGYGIQISPAQVSRILTQGHDEFHKEKEDIALWPKSRICASLSTRARGLKASLQSSNYAEAIHKRKQELLLALDHPQIPLHNNDSERDIREVAKKRKISAGTRSDAGRDARAAFLSLKKTCMKLNIRFLVPQGYGIIS